MDHDTYTLSRKSLDLITCTAQVVAQHLETGYATPVDAEHLRQAVKEVETEIQHRQYMPKLEQQRMLWGD
jgi:hypothetical protein